jgi:hypothetical protein
MNLAASFSLSTLRRKAYCLNCLLPSAYFFCIARSSSSLK